MERYIASTSSSWEDYPGQRVYECSTETPQPQDGQESHGHRKRSTKSRGSHASTRKHTSTSTSTPNPASSKPSSRGHKHTKNHGSDCSKSGATVYEDNHTRRDQDISLLHVGSQFQDVSRIEAGGTSPFDYWGTSHTTHHVPVEHYILKSDEEAAWNAVAAVDGMDGWEFVPDYGNEMGKDGF